MRAGELSHQLARDLYGVVFSPDGSPDLGATALARKAMRMARLAKAAPARYRLDSPTPTPQKVRHDIGETFSVLEDNDGRAFMACHCCRATLSPANQNYKEYCPSIFGTLCEADSVQFSDSKGEVEGEVVLRQYVCGSCGALLQTDVCQPDDAPVWDIALA